MYRLSDRLRGLQRCTWPVVAGVVDEDPVHIVLVQVEKLDLVVPAAAQIQLRSHARGLGSLVAAVAGRVAVLVPAIPPRPPLVVPLKPAQDCFRWMTVGMTNCPRIQARPSLNGQGTDVSHAFPAIVEFCLNTSPL